MRVLSVALIACLWGAFFIGDARGAAPAGPGDLALAGEYSAGWKTVTVTRTSPGTGTFQARLHYPAPSGSAGGENAPLDGGGGLYPAIAFGHGFLQAVTQYQSTCAHLATHGYLVIAPTSEGSLSPSHANFAADLRHALTYLEQQNSTTGAELQGRVRTDAFGVSGHSMGGGCSLLAAAADSRIRCVANLAAAETNPSAVAAMPSIHVPVFLICGSQDTIVPVSSNGQLMYNAANPPKQLPVITGGFHCGFTDSTFPFCDSGSIARADQLAITRRLLTAFFDLNLKKDQGLWREVWGPEAPPGPNGVVLTSNAGFSVVAGSPTAEAAPGGSAVIQITVNNGPVPQGPMSVQAEGGPAGWSGETLVTSPLAGGAAFTGSMLLRAPGLAGMGADSLLVSARSSQDEATRAFTFLSASWRACMADWNGQTGVSVQDIFDFLHDYFESRADFNGVGGTTVQDIFDFLGVYFDACS